MARNLHKKSVLISFLAGSFILFCAVSVTASSMRFAHNTFIAFEAPEGENVTIDCSTLEPAYYTALSFHHSPVPPFYLAPDGKKIIQKSQIFTIVNVTGRDQGTYKCEVKDKSLQSTVFRAAEIITVFQKPKALDLSLQRSQDQNKPVYDTATTKLSQSKPYLYFKQKSPLRKHVNDTKPLELSFSVKGLQPIKMQWKKDDRELMIGARYKTFDNGRQLLVDPPFTLDDSGTYRVSACNSKGCAVRGAQVLFYATFNNTQKMIQDEEAEDEGYMKYIKDLLKNYGFIGIPTVLIIILIIAIACAAGGPSNKEKKKKIKEVTKEIHIHKKQEPAQGVGRSASLWSWHSDEHSSPDELPDYDKMKSAKKGAQGHPQTPKKQEPDYAGVHYGEGDYDLAKRKGEKQYSDRGNDYNSGDAGHTHHQEQQYKDCVGQEREQHYQDNCVENETSYSTRNDSGDNGQHESLTYNHEQHHHDTTQQAKNEGNVYSDEDIYETIAKYTGSRPSPMKDDNNKRTNASPNVPKPSKGYSGIVETKEEEEMDEVIYASFADQMQSGVQPLRAQLLQNTGSVQAHQAMKAPIHSVDMHDDDDDDDFEDAANDLGDFKFYAFDIMDFD